MPEKRKWTVSFRDKLDTKLKTDKLEDGKVPKKVQREIRKAIRHAVVSTLAAHNLLDVPGNANFLTASAEDDDGGNPIK